LRISRRRPRSLVALCLVLLLASVASPIPAVGAATPLFTDGFESGTTSAWTTTTRFTVQNQTTNTGLWAGRAASTGQSSSAARTFSSIPEAWIDLYFQVESRTTAVWFLTLHRVGGGQALKVGLNGKGRLIVRNAVQGQTITSSTTIAPGAWFELAVHAKTGASGRFDVTLDGVAIAQLSRDADLGGAGLKKLTIGDTSSGRRFSVAFDDVRVAPDAPGGSGGGGDPQTIGRWSPTFDLGVAAVHMTVLRTGKVLVFYRTSGAIETVARLWDPATGEIENVDANDGNTYNYFCSGTSLLPDGRVFITGGTIDERAFHGETGTAFFDPITESWSRGPEMASARWYPSNLTLPDSDVLIFSGSVDADTYTDDVERYDVGTDSLETLPAAADLDSPYLYPRVILLDDGTVVRVGMDQRTMYLDPQSATWSQGPLMRFGNRSNGSVIALPGGRVLAIGGRDGSPPTRTTEVIDFDVADPTWRYSGSMAEPRQHMNAVLLPDGNVLVVGGTRSNDSYGDPVYDAEMYDPVSEAWTTMDATTAPRAYHSTAALLPDGRVVSAGQTNGSLATTAEIYEPPYLFAGPRPVIGSAPGAIHYGDSFTVATDDAARVDEVMLIRSATVSHGVNFDQRSVPLPFTAGDDSLTVQAPDAAVDAPPGWYMLFLLDGGVPSVATWIHVD